MLTHEFRFKGIPYDPRDSGGPLQLNKLHLNSVHCTPGGMYITGLKTGGMLLYNGEKLQMAVELPPGTHNARPFRDGVLFNDTESDALRYAGRGEGLEDRAFKVPRFDPERLQNRGLDTSGIARQGFARGLCVLSDTVVAGGSSPSTVSSTTSPRTNGMLSVNLTHGRPERHPRPRRVAVRLSRAGGPSAAGVADRLRQLLDDVAELLLPERRGASRSGASSRARPCRSAAGPARSLPSSPRARFSWKRRQASSNGSPQCARMRRTWVSRSVTVSS